MISLRCALTVAVVVTLPEGAVAAEPRSVLEVARSFKDGGGYVWEGGSGAPRAIEFDGQTVVKAQDKGTYCSGFTFSVAMRTAAQRGLLEGKTIDEVRRFQKEWYGVPQEAAERQCALAVEKLRIGKEIKGLAAARPGDFVQIWRNNKSGHSVVLIEWIRQDGQIIGLKYRSSQKSTDGIGDRVEYFADAPGKDGRVLRDRTYIARLDESPRS